MKLKIGGLDPSLRNFGMCKGTLDLTDGSFILDQIALVQSDADKLNSKTVRKNSDDIRRAATLYDGTKQFFHDVNLICVEVPVGSQSANGMKSYGVCIGVLGAFKSSKTLIQVTPNDVKLVATGSKQATKQDMIDWATKEFPSANWFKHSVKGKAKYTAKNEHIADAIAALYAGVKGEEFQALKTIYLNNKIT